MRDALYLAVDLSPEGGRAALCGLEPGEFLLDDVCRFRYPPSDSQGELRWDVDRVFDEIKTALLIARRRARSLGMQIRSIGVAGWGCDYGLVDAQGQLVEAPIACVDSRAIEAVKEVLELIPREQIFQRTGSKLLPCNTLFQFYASAQRGISSTAARMLMIPDLINLFLTGIPVNEYTNATTTQLLNAATGEWDYYLAMRLGLRPNLLGEIVPAGSTVGVLKQALADELGIATLRVVAPATHNLASSIAGTPLRHGWAFISSGCQSFVGVERDRPLINGTVASQGFSNQGGPFGTVCLFRSVKGLGLLEACLEEWREQGLWLDADRLADQAAAIEDSPAFIVSDARHFHEPRSMLYSISRYLVETGQRVPTEPAEFARIILDSVALSYASVVRKIEDLTGEPIGGVQISGRGSENSYLNQGIANATGLPVVAGPIDAAVVGNSVVQAIASGRFSSLVEARSYVAEGVGLKTFRPERLSRWQAALRRYAEIEVRFSRQPLTAPFSVPTRIAG